MALKVTDLLDLRYKSFNFGAGQSEAPPSWRAKNVETELPPPPQANEVSRILASGVPPDVRDISGFTSLHLSADRGHRDACALLIQKARPFQA